MKKIFSLVVLLASVLMFTSCGKDDASYTTTPKLDVAQSDVLFEAEGGTGTITINNASAVTATTESTWLTVSANGNVVTATASLNPSLDGRSATIVIKSGDAEAVVSATQKGSVYGIVGGLEYELADTAQASASIPVVHTQGVTVQSLTEWLTASFNSETSAIEVSATSNDTEDPRVGYVAFQTGDIKDTLAIVQSGMLFIIDKTSVAIPNEGGVEGVTIMHSKPVTVETTAEWMELAWNDATGVLTIAVDENPALARQGSITVTSGEAVKTISVIQYDPASLGNEMTGDYYFLFFDKDDQMSYFPATLTETSLDITALGWSIPATLDKEKLTVSVNSGCFVGTYSTYFMYLLFVDESNQYWTGTATDVTATAPLALTDMGDGELTLAGDFAGTLASGAKIGSFLFSAFSEQSLDLSQDGPYLGDLLVMYQPGLMKMPAADEPTAAPKAKRAAKVSSVPFSLKRRTK